MSITSLMIVNENSSVSNIELETLRQIKESMYEALVSQDWSTLKCLDRVCGRVINQLCMKDEAYLLEMTEELGDIKQIYTMALESMYPKINNAPIQLI